MFDITLQGVSAGAPRQSTASGVQAGYSAYWLYDTDSTVANLTLREQGWKIKNICFQPPASTAIALPLNWLLKGNRFLNVTNGVSAAFSYSVIKENFFSDGGTPATTCVLSTAGGSAGANNFVINNYFQTTTANFNTPDIIGNATDVWNNISIDGADLSATSIGREVGTPA